MHHGENWEGREFCDDNDDFARVYNNLLLRNMNTFITLQTASALHATL